MTRAPRTTAGFLAIVVTALAVGGCGSEEPDGKKLPAATATELSRQLTSIDNRVAFRDGGACDDIFKPIPDGNIDAIDKVMAEIPSGVDPDIRAALEQSIDRLKQLIDSECREIVEEDERERQQQEEEPAPEEEEPTTPTTPTTEEPVETQPTTPEPEPTPDEEQDEGAPPGNGPDGEGPPGQTGGGGANAPSGGEEGDE